MLHELTGARRWVIEYLPIALFHLLERMGSIKRRDGNVAAVYL
jgi:hypothetical protein